MRLCHRISFVFFSDAEYNKCTNKFKGIYLDRRSSLLFTPLWEATVNVLNRFYFKR